MRLIQSFGSAALGPLTLGFVSYVRVCVCARVCVFQSNLVLGGVDNVVRECRVVSSREF